MKARNVIFGLLVGFILIAPGVSAWSIYGFESNTNESYGIVQAPMNGITWVSEGSPYLIVDAGPFNGLDIFTNFQFADGSIVEFRISEDLFLGDILHFTLKNSNERIDIGTTSLVNSLYGNSEYALMLDFGSNYTAFFIANTDEGYTLNNAIPQNQGYALIIVELGAGGTLLIPAITTLQSMWIPLVGIMMAFFMGIATCILVKREFFAFDIFVVTVAISIGILIWTSVFELYMIIFSVLLLAGLIYYRS